jgi:hypothetical protein
MNNLQQALRNKIINQDLKGSVITSWDFETKAFYHLKDAFLQRKWPKEASNSEDNLYKSF